MNHDQQKEYEEHFSPDGEYIQYQMEHPEMNDQPMNNTIKPSRDKTVENTCKDCGGLTTTKEAGLKHKNCPKKVSCDCDEIPHKAWCTEEDNE